MLVLAEMLVKEGRITGINVRDVTVQEGKMADEMMLIGSGILVKPVLQWDDHIIRDGKNLKARDALYFSFSYDTEKYIEILIIGMLLPGNFFPDRQRRSCG